MRLFVAMLAVALWACPAPTRVPEDAGDVNPDAGAAAIDGGPSTPEVDGGLLPVLAPLPPGARVTGAGFATAPLCGDCHSATATTNVDEQGRPQGLFEEWSATPMANAARDPLFRAALANEQARAPAAADAIASVCLRCHAGMGVHAQAVAGVSTTAALLTSTATEGALARDGVSCALCHRVQPDGLGQEQTFSGRYALAPVGVLYGPYAAPFTTPMVNRLGLTPTEGRHVQSSALCGSCHALVTEELTEAGAGTGHLLGEQLTYLEWRRSAFSTEGGGTTPRSCQDCHMPDLRADGAPLFTRLAHRPDGTDFTQLAPRGPFSRHGFLGANTLLPALLRAGRASLNPVASDAALEAAELRSRSVLRTQAARVELKDVAVAGGMVSFTVAVHNLTGHKFPSGYPSRRAFLHVTLRDASGAVLFESGAVNAAQQLVGADGQPLAAERAGGPAHPHRAQVASADEVVVYESVMDDGAGRPSSDLLGAHGFLKDNRLLPAGHADSSTGPLSTAPVGVVDPDFVAGGDEVRFGVRVGGTPARVEVALRYQVFSPRYLEQLLGRATPEAAAVRVLWAPETLAPALVDEAAAPVP